MQQSRWPRFARGTRLAVSLGVLTALCLGAFGVWQAAADDVASSEAKGDRSRAALHAALEKNLSYGRDWLAAKDWKSLLQTAEGMLILAQVLGQQGDDEAWRRTADALAGDVQALRTAAEGQRADECKDLLGRLTTRSASLAKLTPKGKAKAAGLKVPLRPLMHLMDATHADAKAALAAEDVAEAKTMARVLSELGRVVSNQRADAEWRAAGEALVRAALAATDEEHSDAKTVRQQLRGVYEKCEACHKRQR